MYTYINNDSVLRDVKYQINVAIARTVQNMKYKIHDKYYGKYGISNESWLFCKMQST